MTSKLIVSKNIYPDLKPEVTIGVCVRNSSETIDETLQSILAQDFPHERIEVIFVDDGSEDETLSKIENFISKMDMQVKLFHHNWKGLGPSRNIVVENARGKFIIWVDGDMVLPKDHIRRQVKFMQKNPKVGIAKAKYGFLPGDNLVAMLENLPCVINNNDASKTESRYPGTGGSIYRVKAIRQIGGFDNCLTSVGEDQDAAYRIREAGWLITRSGAFFFEVREKTWRDLWRKYCWYGYGNYFLYKKNRSIFKLCMMFPLVGFLAGLLYSFTGYKYTGKKLVFLLPFHYAFKMTAWCKGFFSAYFKDFKHRIRSRTNKK